MDEVFIFSTIVIKLYFNNKIILLFCFMKIPKKASPNSFSPVTSTNVGLSSKNFLPFTFNPFATLVQSFRIIPSDNPKLLNLNQDYPSKKVFFWSNCYKIEVMITSLEEMLELPNFGHMTKLFDSRDNILLVTSYTELMTS